LQKGRGAERAQAPFYNIILYAEGIINRSADKSGDSRHIFYKTCRSLAPGYPRQWAAPSRKGAENPQAPYTKSLRAKNFAHLQCRCANRIQQHVCCTSRWPYRAYERCHRPLESQKT